MNRSRFEISEGKGFHMTFSNNWHISVQFGKINYCSRKGEEVNDYHTSPNAEIAVWSEPRQKFDFVWLGNDQVRGWCTTDEVAEVISIISKAKSTLTNKQMSKKLDKVWK